MGVDVDANVVSTIRFCALTDEPVLILGESGTEKGPVAEAIHHEWEQRQVTYPASVLVSEDVPEEIPTV